MEDTSEIQPYSWLLQISKFTRLSVFFDHIPASTTEHSRDEY